MLTIDFHGPRALLPNPDAVPYLLAERDAWSPGVYLWAFMYNKAYRVNFVGIGSHSMAERHNEHLVDFLSGRRRIYRAADIDGGQLTPVYDPQDASERFVQAIPELMAVLVRVHVFYAPFDGSEAVLERIGTALAAHFQGLGGRAAAWLDNEPVRYDANAFSERLTLRLGRPAFIASLPDEMHI